MAYKQPLFIEDNGFAAETDPATDSLEIGGLEITGAGTPPDGPLYFNDGKFTGVAPADAAGQPLVYNQEGAELTSLVLADPLDMNNTKITNSDAGSGADGATKGQLDLAAEVAYWTHPVTVIKMCSDALSSPATLTPAAGDAYIVGATPAGGWSALTAGNVVEYNGTAWVVVAAAVAEGMRIGVTDDAAKRGGSFASSATATVLRYHDSAWSVTNSTEGTICIVIGGSADSFYQNLSFEAVGNAGSLTWDQFAGYIAGTGLRFEADNRTLAANAGDGVKIETFTGVKYLSLDLTADPGLYYPAGADAAGKLSVQIASSTPALTRDSSGLHVLVDNDLAVEVIASGIAATVDGVTADVDANGLAVLGLPAEFMIDDEGVSVNVTASNLTELTDTSVTTLHTHPGVDEVQRIEEVFTAGGAVTKGKPVYVSAADTVEEADADTDSMAWVNGIASADISSSGSGSIIIRGKCPAILTSATAGQRYYLASGGGLTTDVPATGRIIRMGWAINDVDFWVQPFDMGKKTA